MLEELRIRNLAVVEDAVLTFGAGLNALTGSTGAGKSLILGAVNLLLGGRGSAQAIRAGADSASVEGVFRVGKTVDDVLIAAAAPGQDGRITLRREVERSGRSRAFVNGHASTLKQLQDLSTQLIEPHGQNEQLQLKQVENHVVYVDRYANSAALLSAYGAALEDFQAVTTRIADFEKRVALAREKKELLEHRVSEISQAAVRKGEKAELEESLRVLAHAHEIFEALREGGGRLYEDESSAVSQVAEVKRRIDRLAELDRRLEGFAEALERAEIQLTETASEMRAYVEHLEFEPEDLERKQERLEILVGLERRYKMPVDDLIDHAKAWSAELDALVFEDEERIKLGAEKTKCVEHLRDAGVELSALRRKAALDLDRLMTREIGPLMLKGARFRTHVALDTDAGSDLTVDGERVRVKTDGFDHVAFRFQANPGEAETDLSDSASSGELSRLALALKTIANTGREGSVLVFDEIDQGVGADMGDVIASKLEALSHRYQVICITHMPQIAARSGTHLVVRKATRGERTVTEVAPAHGDGRVQEIARMLGGESGSDKRLALAREMLHLGKDQARVRP